MMASKFSVPVMAGITDRIQLRDEIVDSVLLEANPHSEPLSQRRRTDNLPSSWNAFCPRMFDLEVVPPLMQRVAQRGSNKERQEENGLEHLWKVKDEEGGGGLVSYRGWPGELWTRRTRWCDRRVPSIWDVHSLRPALQAPDITWFKRSTPVENPFSLTDRYGFWSIQSTPPEFKQFPSIS